MSGVGNDFNESIERVGMVDFGRGTFLILIRNFGLEGNIDSGEECGRLDGSIDFDALAIRQMGQSNLVDGIYGISVISFEFAVRDRISGQICR